PSYDSDVLEDGSVPLARLLAARLGANNIQLPPRVIIYRWPLEARAGDREELAELVHDVLAEQVANLLGLDPDDF
ncbi:MAG TPA: metallopeptidase family protein, partial [Mycobacteriales bacterium]|nr:metallopeptidase family protein [Mycobacteriales bacterium]